MDDWGNDYNDDWNQQWDDQGDYNDYGEEPNDGGDEGPWDADYGDDGGDQTQEVDEGAIEQAYDEAVDAALAGPSTADYGWGNALSWEQFLAENPATREQEQTPWMSYNQYLEDMQPGLANWADIYGGVNQMPSWFDSQFLGRMGQPFQLPDWGMTGEERAKSDLYEYLRHSGRTPLGWDRGILPATSAPDWQQQMAYRQGQVWNPFEGGYEIRYPDPNWGQANAWPESGPRPPRPTRGGGGWEPPQPRALRPGSPEYEAIWPFRNAQRNPVNWIYGV